MKVRVSPVKALGEFDLYIEYVTATPLLVMMILGCLVKDPNTADAPFWVISVKAAVPGYT